MRSRSPLYAAICAGFLTAASLGHVAGCSSAEGSSSDAGVVDRGPILPGPDTVAWTPANLFPALWLDGDEATESGGGVTQWTDRSGNGNHAIVAVADGSASRPVRVDIHGHKALAFDGFTRMLVGDSPSLQWGTDDFAFFAVLRCLTIRDPSKAFGVIYARTASTAPYPGVQLFLTGSPSAYVAGAEQDHRVTSVRNGYDDGQVHLLMLRRTGPSLELRVDGALAGRITTTAASVTVNDGNGTIAGAEDGSKFLQADIAMLLGIRGTVAEEDLTKVEAYAKERYGL